MDKSVLEVDSVQKYFGNKLVVSDVYLKCETGNIIGLLGRNGSGKSTLLKIIFGIVAADTKFVRINGVVKTKSAELLKDISYLHQDNFIPSNLSVKKAIELSIPKNELERFFEDEMISKLSGKKIHQLSGGELRYLEIKIILGNNSKFAFLDEPYNGLSPILASKINDLISAQSSVKGIIISDHNYRNVIAISTHLILMKDGKAHHLKDKSELVDKGYLKEGML